VTLLPALGVRGTLFLAVGANLAVAMLALVLGRERLDADDAEPEPEHGVPVSWRTIRVVWAGIAVSGFAAMVYEVAWTRGLVQVFGNSTYAFTTMLTSFLIGLAAGAWLAERRLGRIGDPVACFALVEAWIALSAAGASACLEWLPGLGFEALKATGGEFAPLLVFQLGLCILVMLPTTLGLGFALPLVAKLSAPRVGGAGRSIGLPYAWNTVGAVPGAIAAGFWILPHWGVGRSVVLAAGLNLLVAAAALRAVPRGSRPLRPVLALGVLCLAACLKLAFVQPDPRVLSAGVYSTSATS